MPDIESAIFLQRSPEAADSKIDRVYFGAEFCPWRFPTVETIVECYDICQRFDFSFTLVTPVLNETFLPLFIDKLRRLAERLPADVEIVVSDLGAIPLCKEYFPKAMLTVGRVLSGQKRGPRILNLDLNNDQLHYFQQGSWYSKQGAELLAAQGVERIELDNLLQGIAPVTNGLKATLHHPYIMVTSSRNCPYRSTPPGSRCQGGCGEVFTLKNAESTIPLLQGGNTQFLANAVLPGNCAALGIDRIVYHPKLPY